jgi:hypothetical protein
MFDLETLQPVVQDGAKVVKYTSTQYPFSIVLAEVANGTLLVEVSTDAFVADTRRLLFIDASTNPLDIQRWEFARVMQTEIFRITTVGANVKSTLRIQPTNLSLVP